MIVYLDGEKRDVAAGAVVKHLLDDETRAAAAAGEIVVLDAWGHVVGLEGAASAGGSYFVVAQGAKPPSVQACLAAWPGGGGLPGELAKYLIRRAIEKTRAAGGGASPAATVAFARAALERRDADAVWSYLAGEKKTAAVFPVGTVRVRDYLPAAEAVVIATRDLLTFAYGTTAFDYLAGRRIVEIGTTNKAKPSDYERVLPAVDAVVVCRRADFAIAGFAVSAEARELAALAARAGKPLINICGGVAMVDPSGTPVAFDGEMAILSSPVESPDVDVVFTGPGIARAGVPNDGVLRDQTAAALWDLFLKERV